MAQHPSCCVAIEACVSAHHWAREMSWHGHEVRLIAPNCVKPFIKRQKNDAADAEAIVEAALRPTMRFVEPKTADQRARATAFRTREQFVKQRTETINALRSYLYEFGHVAPTGIGFAPRLARVLEEPNTDMPELARDISRMLVEQIAHLTEGLKDLKARIETMSSEAEMPRRPRTMPGGGPITALAVETFAPPMGQFRRGRDFAAWLGLVPRQHSTGGMQKLGEEFENGVARHPTIADHRCHGRDPMGHPARRAEGLGAGSDAGAQTPVGGRGGSGEQDGARHLGDAHAGRGLSWPGADRRLIGRRAGIVATEL
jgi:transposase